MKKTIFILTVFILLSSLPVLAAGEVVVGTIETIDIENMQITVLGWDDMVYKINLSKSIQIKDLYFGQEIIATVANGYATELKLIQEEDPERDGYIIPGTRFRLGTVLFVSHTEIEIITTKSREKYKIDPFSTFLYKRGVVVDLRTLKEGDRVLLTFDDPYTTTVSEIKIEDEEKHIEGIVKGRIEIVDERNKEILISEPETLVQEQWLLIGQKMKMKLGTGSIYEGGKKLTLSNLQKRKGIEAYIAYESTYGRPQISKMLLKVGPSMEYMDLLQDINYGTGQMVVNANNFSFHQGTIVVKDNRLVDNLNLNQYQELYLVSDYKNGALQASIVSIQGTSILEDRIDNSRLLVYKGKIEDILDYRLILGSGYKLDKGLPTASRFIANVQAEKLIFTESTYIYDSELKTHIPTKFFQESKYIDLTDIKDKELKDRLEKQYYKNKPAYIVARQTEYGKEILSINLVPQEDKIYNQNINLDHSTIGEIRSIDQGSKSIELTNIANYNNLTKRWEKAVDINLSLENAIVLQNDQPISLEELYTIRKRSKAYLVNQKQSTDTTTYILLIEN